MQTLCSHTVAMKMIWLRMLHCLFANFRNCQEFDTALMACVCRKAASYGSERYISAQKGFQEGLKS